MSGTPRTELLASCACGSVEVKSVGDPIVSAVCYCDDCQEGARQIEALPGAPAIADADGGTACMLFRKDRIAWSKGEPLLKGHKIKEKSASNRVVATCCNSAMYLNFDDSRHWVSAYRNRFHGGLPPLQMRICTKFRPKTTPLPTDVLGYPSYPLRMVTKLVAAKVSMLLGL
jgi:hypothetical protein